MILDFIRINLQFFVPFPFAIESPVTETLKKVNKARKELSAHLGRMPSDDELANFMNISVDKLRKISDKTRAVVSLESPISMGSNHRSEMDQRTIGDSIASDAPTPEEDAEHKLLQQDIRAVVNQLAEREREVLILRFENFAMIDHASLAKLRNCSLFIANSWLS